MAKSGWDKKSMTGTKKKAIISALGDYIALIDKFKVGMDNTVTVEPDTKLPTKQEYDDLKAMRDYLVVYFALSEVKATPIAVPAEIPVVTPAVAGEPIRPPEDPPQ